MEEWVPQVRAPAPDIFFHIAYLNCGLSAACSGSWNDVGILQVGVDAVLAALTYEALTIMRPCTLSIFFGAAARMKGERQRDRTAV